MKLNLNEVVLIGRTFEEYCGMFALSGLKPGGGRILDAGSGVCSFGAEGRLQGLDITSCDRIYGLPAEAIEKKCAADLEEVMGKLPDIQEMYRWEFFRDIPHLKSHREKAYKTFLEDYRGAGRELYFEVSFPQSGLKDKEFALTLVSHFLILYDEHLDYDFHKNTLLELLRITSGEIRIFPTVNLSGERPALLDLIRGDEAFKHCSFQEVRVGYEFVRNGNRMLVIKQNEGEIEGL